MAQFCKLPQRKLRPHEPPMAPMFANKTGRSVGIGAIGG